MPRLPQSLLPFAGSNADVLGSGGGDALVVIVCGGLWPNPETDLRLVEDDLGLEGRLGGEELEVGRGRSRS